MPTLDIIDNRGDKLVDHIRQTLPGSQTDYKICHPKVMAKAKRGSSQHVVYPAKPASARRFHGWGVRSGLRRGSHSSLRWGWAGEVGGGGDFVGIFWGGLP